MEPRRLKGHKGALTCCIASRSRPGVVVSSGEDGLIIGFDLRCGEGVIFSIDVGKKPVTSLCFKPGNEDALFASGGSNVYCFDIRTAFSQRPVETYSYNKDEINQITFTHKSDFLAAADDSGEVKILDTRQQTLYKTLRAVHENICSTVQFLHWKPWTAVTGGLDSKIVTWDFSKGRPWHIINYGSPVVDVSNSNAGQFFNPPFVHEVATSETYALPGLNKLCVAARGDGVVEVINMESELASMKSKSSPHAKKGLKAQYRDGESSIEKLMADQGNKKRVRLDYSIGGHTSAVSCVSFALFGEPGKLLISGGNDACVKVWDLSKHLLGKQTISEDTALPLSINVRKKINCVCSTPAGSENLIVCDTSKFLKAYIVA